MEKVGMKKVMFLGREDRTSGLPDSLIQHIISFLPSTKEAIRTGILSKRWLNQWTRVPVLIFEYPVASDLRFSRFVDNALHLFDCSNIRKFHIHYKFEKDPNFISKLRFVIRKNVQDLILHRDGDAFSSYKLPKFLLDTPSLLKLHIVRCDFLPIWRINWPSLKVLKLQGCFSGGHSIENVLSGTPSLQSLEIKDFIKRTFFTFSSTSLKILIFEDIQIYCSFHISCPVLEELYVKRIDMDDLVSFPGKAIQDFVSGSPVLHTLEIVDCLSEELVISSKSLKKLVLGGIDEGAIEISCPNVEELDLYGLGNDPFKVTNFQSLIRATLNCLWREVLICAEDVAILILEQLQNVRELSMGTCFIEVLADVKMEGLSYPWSNNKILTLVAPSFEHLPGIMLALRSSSTLERLVIKLDVHETLHAFGESYWNSNGTVVNCLVSHLKTVEIIGLSKKDAQCELVLNFIKFLLKNTRVLEKLVLVISEDGEAGFAFHVSQKVSSFPRCSPHAIVELSCSK